MKHSDERRAFDGLVDRVLSVSHEEIKRRESEYKKLADANPRKRGPKRKLKSPAQVHAVDGP
jgi:hypothetical protein